MAIVECKMRLDKFIASMGFGSRKEVKNNIRKGLVTVNDNLIKDPGFGVIRGKDRVTLKNQPITYEDYQYFMLHKPAGVISATEDPKHKTVLDLLTSKHRKDLFPVGRLDIDTEGLLIITNDGELAHNLLSPKKHVEKIYYARIQGVVTEEDVEAFKNGVNIDDDYTTMPADLKILKSDQVSKVEIIIKEGKFHQIKKMFEARDKKVIYLKRMAMGRLQLDPELKLGEYRVLKVEEIELLKNR
ncbi:pseudouridine synthase [Vallitalea okinawensis]|uniref:pseudouridine synthase n=1 Tax=Vallitalea okinawensis TaxID=2078660 RepID=UPI001A9A61D1